MRKPVEYRTASKETFKAFKQTHPDVKIDFTTWANIIYTFNYAFRDYALETGHKCKYIFGFGEFAITKWKPHKTTLVDGEEKINLPVDWKKTKEYGKRIFHMNYHTDGYKFRWIWFTNSGRFWCSQLWNFKPSRVTSRLLNHYVNLPDYKEYYLSWKK
jgi:hypothetical protein